MDFTADALTEDSFAAADSYDEREAAWLEVYYAERDAEAIAAMDQDPSFGRD